MTAQSPRYRWLVVVLLAAIGGLNYGDRSAIASVFPLLRAEFHLSDVALGAIGSCFLWAYAPASPLAGILADRVSRSRLIVWSLAAWSVVTVLTGLITNVPELLLTRVCLGALEAAYVPAAIALIADYHDGATRATAMGLFAGGSALGVVLGGTGLGYLGEHYGWRAGFFVLGGAGLALAAGAQRLLRDAPAAAAEREPSRVASGLRPRLQALLRIRSYRIILGASMAVAVSNWTFLNWLPLYFKETYRSTLAEAGFAGTFLHQGAAIIAGVLGGIFSDRVARGKPWRRMTIQSVACFLAAPLLGIFLWRRPALWPLVVCALSYSFLLCFGTSNVTPTTCELLPSRLRGTAIGLSNATNCFAGGIGVLVAGFLKARFGLGGVFAGISGMIFLSAGLMLLGARCFLPADLRRAQEADPGGLEPEAVVGVKA